jgi:thiamine-monophosphate kinase
MTNSGSDRPGEFALIAELFAPLAKLPGAFGLKDDAAIATPPAGHDLVVTTDAIVEGVHFFATDPPELIVKKALRVNLSDLAAKGCTPAGYLMALSLPMAVDMAWLRAFAGGLEEDQKAFAISLLGGDTTSTPGPLTIAITALGHVPAGRMIRRNGARVGDRVFVSGTIGDAGAGLAYLKNETASLSEEDRRVLTRRFQLPEPRLSLGRHLLGIATSAIDVSDGLVADLGHIADVSGVGILIHAGRVPISPALKNSWQETTNDVSRAVCAGDDYEIAFTAAPENRDAVASAAAKAGVSVAEIGRVESGQGVSLLDESGAEIPIEHRGYTHF